MARPPSNTLDDSYTPFTISDFSGGRNTERNRLKLASNESPDQKNGHLSQPGRYPMRGGWQFACENLPAGADGFYFMFDVDGARHILEWTNGDIYETTSGAPILKVAGAYTAGQRVVAADFVGFVYWSDGIVTLQQYDPVAGTNTTIVSSGAPGTITPPAFDAIAVYAGSLLVHPVDEDDIVRWCNVNAVNAWLGVSAQAVGQGTGGKVNSIAVFGLAQVGGVVPQRTFFVGKSKYGVFSYAGALGTTTENIIQIDAGVLDPDSVKFINGGPDTPAGIVFLGTDRRLWWTNAYEFKELSLNIATELSNEIVNRLIVDAGARFVAVKNTQEKQYVLDIGDNVQFAYHYSAGGWTLYEGWPSGMWVDGFDELGAPAIFSADRSTGDVAMCNTGFSDNGDPIEFYWESGDLTMGDSSRLKIVDFVNCVFTVSRNGLLDVTVSESISYQPADERQSATVRLTPPDFTSGLFVLDESVLDGPDVLGEVGESERETFDLQDRIAVEVPEAYAYGIEGLTEQLTGSQIRVRAGQTTIAAYCELLSIQLLYVMSGHVRVGNAIRQ